MKYARIKGESLTKFKRRYAKAGFSVSVEAITELIQKDNYICVEVLTDEGEQIGWFIYRIDPFENDRHLVLVHAISNEGVEPLTAHGVIVMDHYAKAFDCSHCRVHADDHRLIAVLEGSKDFKQYEVVFIKEV